MILFIVKAALRIRNSAYDDEISDLISAAQADLMLSGVLPSKATDTTDALIKRAIILYVKAQFGLDNKDSEKYNQSYVSLKTHLTLSQEYTVEAVV